MPRVTISVGPFKEVRNNFEMGGCYGQVQRTYKKSIKRKSRAITEEHVISAIPVPLYQPETLQKKTIFAAFTASCTN